MAVEPTTRPDRSIVIENEEGDEGEPRLKQIRKRFMTMQTFWSSIHDVGLDDDKFVAGEQWPDEIRKERQEDQRPILTYNMLPSFTRQITNKIRENRSQVKVTPVENNKGPDPRMANLGGTKDYSLADVYSGIIKNIEHVSRAEQAYDTSVKHAVDHGFGFFYLMNEWSRVDPFVQELKIHRIKNSYSVYLDPDSQEADYRDMQDGFVFHNIHKTTFEAKWPDVPNLEFETVLQGQTYEGWYEGDNIRIAQYFWIDWKDDEVVQLSNGKVVYWNDTKDVLDDLEEEWGIHILDDDDGNEMRKAVLRPVCMWQKMTGKNILEGPTELPFSAVPIFPVLGEEMFVDGRIRYESAIRFAKDPQKSYNYWRTAAAETVALAPRAPWVGTEAQFAGHEELWEEANRKNLPYLTYNHKDGIPAPARVQPSTVAAAELQNATQDSADMQTIIGLHDPSLGRDQKDKSGKAILALQSQGSTSTFQFPDNLARAKEQCGRLMVEAIPRIYDTQRIMRIRLPDDTDDFVEINQTVDDAESDKSILVHDINYGRYDVTMETGPSYATQRQEASDLQLELLKVLGPEKASNIVHLIVKNMGVPGSDEVAAVLRKMLPEELKSEEEKMADLPKGVVKDPETGELTKDGEKWQPPITPEMQIMQKQQEIDELKAQAERATAEAKMATAEADTKQAEAKIAQAEADTAELESEIGDLRQQLVEGKDSGDQMTEIGQIIERVMKEHEVDPNAHKAATAEQIADAVVEALKRTKAYVDRKHSSGRQLATIDNQGAPTPSAPASVGGGGGGVNITLSGPQRIEFEYDDNGNITAAVPVTNSEAA